MSEWQPIESAPKDGTRIILTDGLYVEVGCWSPNVHGDEYPWAFVDNYSGIDTVDGGTGVQANAFKADQVTAWMPLPAPPTQDEGKTK